MHLRSRDYLEDFEKVYGGAGLLPALDGADHFRYRKSTQPGYSRTRLEEQLDLVYSKARESLANWNVGDAQGAVTMCRNLVNSELSPLSLSIDSQDVAEDMHKFKERALKTHLIKMLPKFMLKTAQVRLLPWMKRKRLTCRATWRTSWTMCWNHHLLTIFSSSIGLIAL